MSNLGTYVVVLKNEQQKAIQIGRMGEFQARKGYYVYIGSAMGSGGVVARLRHHRKISKKPHWHLDYLRTETEFYEAYALFSLDRKECAWATLIAGNEQATEPMQGFGSSDCQCDTHLFYFSSCEKMKRAIRAIPMARKIDVDKVKD